MQFPSEVAVHFPHVGDVDRVERSLDRFYALTEAGLVASGLDEATTRESIRAGHAVRKFRVAQ